MLQRSGRKGFTIIELLVVVTILVILAGLITTVIKLAREDGRKVTCLNNLRQLGVAAVAFASRPQNNLRYPQMAWTMWEGYWLEQMQPYYNQNFEIAYCPSDGKPFPMSNAQGQSMILTNANHPWYDPEGSYLKTYAEWSRVQMSYRGSCDGYNAGGYGPKLHDYKIPARNMLLDEAWDNTRWGARQCSRAPDVWPGYPSNIDWEYNWNGLTRHSGGANFLFLDGSVRWIDAYSGPSQISFYPNGSIDYNVQAVQ